MELCVKLCNFVSSGLESVWRCHAWSQIRWTSHATTGKIGCPSITAVGRRLTLTARRLQVLWTFHGQFFPSARASPSLPFPSPAFHRLVPRPAYPPPLLHASGSGLAQPSLPFVGA
ncbi:hypothetical protein ElyMa_000669800 [Elysia marginata]|uniref:Uncharacterized protein n=1 Tax=Elysia marginata TaxID=1093978 RepID=A0AAV4GGE1_9GAST|nr:hypothetical protein ElyMa_000669800 [Elysia marginata]